MSLNKLLTPTDKESCLFLFRRRFSAHAQDQSKSNDSQQAQNIGVASKFYPKFLQSHNYPSRTLRLISKNNIPFTRCAVNVTNEEVPTIAGETKAAPKNRIAILEKNEESVFLCSNDKSNISLDYKG